MYHFKAIRHGRRNKFSFISNAKLTKKPTKFRKIAKRPQDSGNIPIFHIQRHIVIEDDDRVSSEKRVTWGWGRVVGKRERESPDREISGLPSQPYVFNRF